MTYQKKTLYIKNNCNYKKEKNNVLIVNYYYF